MLMIKNTKLKNFIYITIGSAIFGMGVSWFANPNKIVTGGVSGLSIIISYLFKNININIPISALVFILNIPIFIFSLTINGKEFIKKSIIATILMSFWIYVFGLLPNILKIENDMLLSSILVGVFCGTGTGLILRVGASSGGSDMLANSIYKILPQFSIAKLIFIIDSSIVFIGLLSFGPTKTTYAIISIFTASKIINNILGGLRFARAVFIVSDKADEISKEIFEKLNRGNTSINCKGMYTKKEKNILIVVVSPKEIIKLKRIINVKDKNAFIIICPAQEVLGKGFLEN